MRRSLSIIAAAAIAVGASAASLSFAEAAMPRPASVSTSGEIIEIGGRWDRDRGRHHRFRDDDGPNRGWRHHRRQNRFGHYRRRHQPFYFGFPFAFRPHYYPYRNRYNDCFRTWDGQLICRY